MKSKVLCVTIQLSIDDELLFKLLSYKYTVNGEYRGLKELNFWLSFDGWKIKTVQTAIVDNTQLLSQASQELIKNPLFFRFISVSDEGHTHTQFINTTGGLAAKS